MTYTSVKGLFTIPTCEPDGKVANESLASTLVDASGEAAAFIFYSPVSENITKVRFRCGTVTTGGNLDVRIETVDTSTGLPSGTLWSTNTNATQAVLSTDDNTSFETTLTSAASINKGDLVAIVISGDGTFNGNIQGSVSAQTSQRMPYFAANASGTWSYISARRGAIAPYFSSSGYVVDIPNLCPADSVGSVTYNNTSTPDIIGNAITPPFDCKVDGLFIDYLDADGDCTLKLLDTNGTTVLASVTIKAAYPPVSNGASYQILLSSTVTLTGGSQYFVVLEPDGASNAAIQKNTFTDSNLKKAYYGYSAVSYASAKDPAAFGDWTVDTAAVAKMGIIISQVDIPAGGASGGSYTFVI